MDIKEVWIEFRDRITSPYFGSFIISWAAINWRIPVVLFFYKAADLKTGKTTYIDFIQRHSDWVNILLLPAILALVYTFAYPWFKRFVNVYIAEQTVKTDKQLLLVNDTTSVSLEKFLATKANLKKKEIELQNVINDESKSKEDYETEKGKNVLLEADISELKKTHQDDLGALHKHYSEEMSILNSQNDEHVKNLMKDANDRVNNANEASSNLIQELELKLSDKERSIKIQRDLLDKRNEEFAALEKRYDKKDQQYLKLAAQEESIKTGNESMVQNVLSLKRQIEELDSKFSKAITAHKSDVEIDSEIMSSAIPIIVDVLNNKENGEHLSEAKNGNLQYLKDRLLGRSKTLHKIFHS